MALHTQADVEKMLQVDFDNDPDSIIAQYIAQSDQIIKSYLGYNIEAQAGIVEVHDGPGTDGERLFLREVPVTAVNSVTEDGTVLVSGTDYVVDTRLGVLLRIWYQGAARVWSKLGYQNISVNYDAGYATIPDDIVHVATRLTARQFLEGASFANNDNIGIVREAIGDYRVSYSDPAVEKIGHISRLNADDMAILARYRRFVYA